MIKFLYLILYAVLFSVILTSCKSEQKPHIESGIDECHHCKMVITETNQACGLFQNNDFVTYCSPACLLTDYDEFRKDKMIDNNNIFFTDYEDNKFIQADSTLFLITKSIPTVMNSGVLTFRSEENAQLLMKQSDEYVTNWIKYRLNAGTPDKIVKVKLIANLLDPGVLIFNKNELIQVDIEKIGPLNRQFLSIMGYEEVDTIKVAEGESLISFRFIADKPGSGFPIMLKGIDKPVGMIKVLGAHTVDEEIM